MTDWLCLDCAFIGDLDVHGRCPRCGSRRRAPLRSRALPKPVSVLHPLKRYPLRGEQMTNLRYEAYLRSGGFCECGCGERVHWYDGVLHHVVSRAKGGQDTLNNVQFLDRGCHQRIHGFPQWGASHCGEKA